MIPGEYILGEEDVIANVGREVTQVLVTNKGDRPVQVGSHFHFFEVNAALEMERNKAYGKRLNLPAGTAMRFEPGEQKEVSLVPFAGSREVWGHHGLVNGSLV
jgi:urease beta subunit